MNDILYGYPPLHFLTPLRCSLMFLSDLLPSCYQNGNSWIQILTNTSNSQYMLKCLISFSGDWDLFESHLVLLTVGTRDWGNSFSMPLVLSKMPKVCPVAAQVIAFKNDGAVCPLLGVFILLQDIQIIYELSTCMLWLVPGSPVPNVCWFWWQLIFVVLNICWFWWQLIFIFVLCWLWDLSIFGLNQDSLVIISNINHLPNW